MPMIQEMVLVLIVLLMIDALFLRGGKRPPFIPLPSYFSTLANFGTVL